MANWHPASESPLPPEWFVIALKEIDPEMRAVWGMERYFRAEWAIERKIESERYSIMYAGVLNDGGPRFVDQPIFDNAQPILDVLGDVVSYVQVGVNKYDLAPEYEWIAFRPTLDQSLLDLIKELWWRKNHPEQAAKNDAAEKIAKDESKRKRRIDAAMEGIPEALLETRKKVQFGYGKTRRETKEAK